MAVTTGNNKSGQARMLLLGGNLGRWKSADFPERIHDCNGIEAWCYAFGGDYCNTLITSQSEIDSYDLVIANLNYITVPKEFDRFLRFAENRKSHVKWVSMIEGSAADYLRPNADLIRLFELSDLVNVINLVSLPFFKSLSKTATEYIGIPYPLEKASQYRVDAEKRKKKIFLSAFMLSRLNDYMVARTSGYDMIGFERRIIRTPRRLFYNLKNYGSLNKTHNIDKAHKFYNDPKLSILPDLQFFDYLTAISDSYLALNLDNRYTWSRFVIDAAVLGIPMITTKSTGQGSIFFPHTVIDNEYEIDKAIALLQRLIGDRDFYRTVSEYPATQLDQLSHDNMKSKLLSYLYI